MAWGSWSNRERGGGLIDWGGLESQFGRNQQNSPPLSPLPLLPASSKNHNKCIGWKYGNIRIPDIVPTWFVNRLAIVGKDLWKRKKERKKMHQAKWNQTNDCRIGNKHSTMASCVIPIKLAIQQVEIIRMDSKWKNTLSNQANYFLFESWQMPSGFSPRERTRIFPNRRTGVDIPIDGITCRNIHPLISFQRHSCLRVCVCVCVTVCLSVQSSATGVNIRLVTNTIDATTCHKYRFESWKMRKRVDKWLQSHSKSLTYSNLRRHPKSESLQ